jgi:hypothetical protein
MEELILIIFVILGLAIIAYFISINSKLDR